MTDTASGSAHALILDPFAGISGDMLLGALVDVGLQERWLPALVESLDLGARVSVERVMRSGIACRHVRFRIPDQERHRHLPDVLEIVEGSGLGDPVVTRASRVFRRIAEAEAAIHGVKVERVHFHEVGALDSILDVVCCIAAIEELEYTRCFTRPVAVGSGTVEIDHGSYPLPAPATARLLEGLAVRETGYAEECTTPTGAALLAELTGGQGPPPEVRYGRIGYGAGSRDPAGRPNCLRVVEVRVCAPRAGDAVHALQADLDDMAPEYVAAARDTLLEAGALDVTLARVEMKKGRPGVRVEALAAASSLDAVVEALFRSTTTIGLRHWPVERVALDRSEETVEWRGHAIRIKTVRLPDGTVRRKPEFDDVAAAARETGLTPYEVRLELDATGGGTGFDGSNRGERVQSNESGRESNEAR